MTEDEAKTKWCPMARNFATDQNGNHGVGNRDADGPMAISNCLASGCMAWRVLGQRTGYCGLAGRLA